MESLKGRFYIPRKGDAVAPKVFYLTFLRSIGMKSLSKLSVSQLRAIYIKERIKSYE